ncbi:MAG: indolepyruvate ferredoxin oxidoreductase subunit alpha [Candidatus Thermoplasmatota archaeon]|nr:indolepyruvate ferredoxin oxidoreductase subunit alpha [Candidatus Thermoplasmatota archaeon]
MDSGATKINYTFTEYTPCHGVCDLFNNLIAFATVILMSYKLIGDLKEGERYFLLTNEAIARAALESSVDVATTYPGTPSSEIGEVLNVVAEKTGLYFEYSVNEKVAFEIAMSAALSKLRAITFMKHVGVNVAMDSLMSSAYIGTDGALVIISADDPSMYSSQNEQDNRVIARFAHLPLFEPSSPQEAMDMLKEALKLSEQFHIPVMMRTTTRVSHLRGMVKPDKIGRANTSGSFKKRNMHNIPLPEFARKMKVELLDKMKRIEKEYDITKWNRIEHLNNGSSHTGIITSGSSYNYVYDVAMEYKVAADVMKIGFSYPLKTDLISSFLKEHDNVIVIEEVDPVIEDNITIIAQRNNIDKKIHGKWDGYIPMMFENGPDIVKNALSKLLNRRFDVYDVPEMDEFPEPVRPPALCPGCPHRASFYIMKSGLRQAGLYNKSIVPTDIGCYTLGVEQPYEFGDVLLSMGSSIGTANGFSQFQEYPVVPVVGDSTFFHAALPGIINAIHNNHDLLYVILDNRTTAMTGGQLSPVNEVDDAGRKYRAIDIYSTLKGIGIDHVYKIDPFDIKNGIKLFREAISEKGVRAIIFERECALITDKVEHAMGNYHLFQVNQNKCIHCMNCVERFSCPAIYKEGKIVNINPYLCDGCGACAKPIVCPPEAIEKVS